MHKNNPLVFPLFRKYVNGRSWFQVDSPDRLIEYQQLGSRWLQHEVTSEKMPDRVFIQDVIDLHEGRWEEVDAAAFASFLQTVEKKV